MSDYINESELLDGIKTSITATIDTAQEHLKILKERQRTLEEDKDILLRCLGYAEGEWKSVRAKLMAINDPKKYLKERLKELNPPEKDSSSRFSLLEVD